MGDEVMKTAFHMSLNPLRLRSMRDEANQVARDMGFENRADIDSFRHAYVSAKVSQIIGGETTTVGRSVATTFGGLNELGGFGNSVEDHFADWHNNEFGVAIADEVNRDLQTLQQTYSMTPEEVIERRERMLRERIAENIRNGQLRQTPFQAPIDRSRSTRAGDVFVHEYDRRTGHVHGYYRSRPDKK